MSLIPASIQDATSPERVVTGLVETPRGSRFGLGAAAIIASPFLGIALAAYGFEIFILVMPLIMIAQALLSILRPVQTPERIRLGEIAGRVVAGEASSADIHPPEVSAAEQLLHIESLLEIVEAPEGPLAGGRATVRQVATLGFWGCVLGAAGLYLLGGDIQKANVLLLVSPFFLVAAWMYQRSIAPWLRAVARLEAALDEMQKLAGQVETQHQLDTGAHRRNGA